MKSKISYDDYVQVILENAYAYRKKEFEEVAQSFEPLLKEPVDWELFIDGYDCSLPEFLLEVLLIQYDINIYCEIVGDHMIKIDITDYENYENSENYKQLDKFWEFINKLNYTVTNDPRK